MHLWTLDFSVRLRLYRCQTTDTTSEEHVTVLNAFCNHSQFQTETSKWVTSSMMQERSTDHHMGKKGSTTQVE